MTFLGGALGDLYRKTTGRRPKTPPKSHIANVLCGHRLDESSGGRLITLYGPNAAAHKMRLDEYLLWLSEGMRQLQRS